MKSRAAFAATRRGAAKMFGPVKKEFSVLRVCLTVVGVLWACPVAAQRSAVEGCSVPLATIDVTQPTFDDELTIFDSIVIADLQVFVDVTHTFVGDLDIAVTHNGTTVGLHAGAGGSGDDIFATFNDAGAPYGTEPFDCDCHLAPSGPGSLSDFDSDTSDGDWTLSINDSYPTLDDGVLTRWCVRAFEEEPAAPPPPLLNLVCNSTPGSGVVSLFWASTLSYDQYDVYIDGELAQQVSGSLPGTTTPPQDLPSTIEICVRGVIDGVASPPRCCMVAIEQEVDIQQCAVPAALISDVFPALSVINVDKSISIGDMQVQIDVEHTFIGDLTIDISSPARTTVRLHDQGGADSDDLKLTFWEFGVPYGTEPSTCGCTMQPSGPGRLTDFLNESTEGLWRLLILDHFLGDFGVLNEWCLRFYENMPVFSVTNLSCEVSADPGTVIVSWGNPTPYDEVQILVNGVVETTLTGPAIQGETTTYMTSALSAPDELEICVIPSIAGTVGPSRCCELEVHLLPPTDIAIDPSGGTGTAVATWVNPVAYDEINVYIDDIPYATLPGNATQYTTDAVAPPANLELCLEGVLFSFGSSPHACRSVMLLDSPNFEACSGPESPISDQATPTIDTVVIAGDEIILDLDVVVTLSHTFLGDLDVELTSPMGTTVRLHDQGGGPSDDIFALFDDDGAVNGSVPFTCGCPVQPSGASGLGMLSDFNFESSAGEWALSVTDNLELDDGILHYWCVRITDSCELLSVGDLTCDVSSGEVLLSWSNRDTYTVLDVLRDGIPIASLPGTATSYLDSEVAAGMHDYQIVAVSSALSCQSPSLICSVAFGITDLVVRGELPFGLVDSVGALVEQLEADGRAVSVVDFLTAEAASPPESEIEAIWIILGTYPANRALSFDEGFLLSELHTGDLELDGTFEETGIPVYFEAGDTWGFDPPTPFNDYDGVANGFISDGDDTLFSLFGQETALGLDFSDGSWDAFYQQDQIGIDYNDQLIVANDPEDLGGSLVASAWLGGESSPDYAVGIFYLSSFAPVIAQSFELGGYLGDLDALVALYRQALLGELAPPAGDPFKRGDFDGDGAVLVNDAIATLNFVFGTGPSPNCPDSSDVDDDGVINITDGIFSLTYLFSNGPDPALPGAVICGADPTLDGLGSCQYEGCN